MPWSADEIASLRLESLRPLWDAFLDTMHAYWSESFPEDMSVPDWREAYERWLRRALGDGERWLWLYRRGDEVLGLANFYVRPERALWGEIAEFYVAPPCRRQGLGRFLVGRIREALRAQGITTIEVSVELRLSSSVAFWRAMGFEPYRYLMLSDNV